MNHDRIKEIALSCGFKTKPQPNGGDDLNPYVYQFAQELIAEAQIESLDKAIDTLADQMNGKTDRLHNLRESRAKKEG